MVLLGIYAWYVKGHFEADADVDAEDLAPLRFHRLDRPRIAPTRRCPACGSSTSRSWSRWACIVLGAVFFVDAVEHLAHALGVDEVLLALVIAPIATELPEKFNSIIWVRQARTRSRWATSPARWSSRAPSPTVVGLVFAGDGWSIDGGSLLAFASAGIAFALALDHLVLLGIEGRGVVLEMLNQRARFGALVKDLRLAFIDAASAAHRSVPWFVKVHRDAVAPLRISRSAAAKRKALNTTGIGRQSRSHPKPIRSIEAVQST